MDDTDRAKRLAAVMENRGWTQEAVETLTGISQPTLSRWFSSETVRMSQRNRRAVDDLLAIAANTADADADRARQAAAKLLAADELEKAAKAAADRLRAEATSNGAGAVAAADAVKEEKKERPRRLGVDE